MNLQTLITTSFTDDIRANLRPSTIASYLWYAERFVFAKAGGSDVATVRTVDLQKAIDTIAVEKPELTHATLTRIKSLLTSVFAHAIRIGVRDDNPARAIRVPKGQRSSATSAVSIEELSRGLELLSGAARTAVAIAGYSGLRAGEIRGLRWTDYDEANGLLYVRRSRWRTYETAPKTAASDAAVPVVARLATILASAQKAAVATGATGSARRIVNANLSNLVERQIKPAFAAAQPTLHWNGWHAYRRGLATTLHSLGVQDKTIQAILRHSSVSITQRAYIKTTSADSRAAMSRMEKAI